MNTDAALPPTAPGGPHGLFPLGRLLRRSLAFVLVFMVLQAGWEVARGSWVERLWVHDLTVRSAAALINVLAPGVHASPQATRIVAPGGGLNVMFGCEGTDIVFLLAAAFAVVPMSARLRLGGLLTGLLWVYALNQLRIVTLFYSFRADRALFELMHATAAPLSMIALTGLFFHSWMQRAGAHGRAASGR